jgi:hypothetical protein
MVAGAVKRMTGGSRDPPLRHTEKKVHLEGNETKDKKELMHETAKTRRSSMLP